MIFGRQRRFVSHQFAFGEVLGLPARIGPVLDSEHCPDLHRLAEGIRERAWALDEAIFKAERELAQLKAERAIYEPSLKSFEGVVAKPLTGVDIKKPVLLPVNPVQTPPSEPSPPLPEPPKTDPIPPGPKPAP